MTEAQMKDQDLIDVAEHLEQKIMCAGGSDRLALQPEFARVLDRIRAAGLKVPSRLRQLEDRLGDEMVEDQFDNMPV